MKTGIKRIEQTLRHLENPPKGAESKALMAAKNSSVDRSAPFETPSLSFNIYPAPVTTPKNETPKTSIELDPDVSPPAAPQIPKLALQDLHLPKPKSVTVTHHRNAPNPALSASLLQDMLNIVTTWQRELTTIVQTIQNIYTEGPVLDAWLESLAAPSQAETIAFRHADISQLLSFVEKLQAGKIQPDDLNSIEDYCTAQKTATYRLCGINPDGKVWTYPCPAEQIPVISMAIARHHQLRQLRIRQADLETRLSHFSEDLVRLHSQLKD
jgi:hypothetical protein